MRSERLTYRAVEPADLDAFSALVQDEHIRRYMMDGKIQPPDWSAAEIRAELGSAGSCPRGSQVAASPPRWPASVSPSRWRRSLMGRPR